MADQLFAEQKDNLFSELRATTGFNHIHPTLTLYLSQS